MNRDDIIRMAKECGYWSGETVELNDVGLRRFAARVAAAEREECAKVCEKRSEDGSCYIGGEAEANGCARAIRARGEK